MFKRPSLNIVYADVKIGDHCWLATPALSVQVMFPIPPDIRYRLFVKMQETLLRNINHKLGQLFVTRFSFKINITKF